MSEWARIVLSVVAGMFAAVLADSLKSKFAEGRKIAKVKELIRIEMGCVVSEVIYFYGRTNDDRSARLKRQRTPVYDYYSSGGKAQLVELQHAWLIVDFYDRYANFMKYVDATPTVAAYEAMRFLQFALVCAKVQGVFGAANRNLIKELSVLPGMKGNSALLSSVD